MAEEDIWFFAQEHLKAEIPAYFKSVLRACGYSNGISIGAIEDEDLQYIQDEVRKGNVGKLFEGSSINYLEGCTKKAAEFEFVLGHKKFLKAIVNFLKTHQAEYGLNSFSLSTKTKKKVQPKTIVSKKTEDLPSKKKSKRGRRMDGRILTVVKYAMKTELEVQQNAPTYSTETLSRFREDLLIRSVRAIIEHTPKMFDEQIEEIKEKLSGNFITFELDEDQQLVATMKCVYCEKQVTGYPNPSSFNPNLWKSTNFNRHLKIIHRFEDNPTKSGTDSEGESDPHESEKIEAKVPKKTGERKEVFSDWTIEGKKMSGDFTMENDLEKPGPCVQNEEGKSASDFAKGKEKLSEKKNANAAKKKGAVAPIDGIQSKSGGTNSLSEDKSDSDTKLMLTEIYNLKNGGKTRHGNNDFIVTKRTCAFDTIISAFASIYSENHNLRNQLDNSRSNISEFVKSLLKWVDKSISQVSDRTEIYASRNIILKELYEGWCASANFSKTQETLFIDCKTGLGSLFARICKFEENLVSAIESKSCTKCGKTYTKLLPFLKTTGKIRNLATINDYLERDSTERLCAVCKSKCTVTTSFNNVVVLETEPTTIHRTEKVTLAKISPQLNIGNIPYVLRAVMHYDAELEHFVAFTYHKNESWNCLDDLKKTVQTVDSATKVHPFILCYATNKRSTIFEESIADMKSAQSLAQKPSISISQKNQQHVQQDVSGLATDPVLHAIRNDKTLSKKRKKNNKMNKQEKKKK